jgi:hypothetical protein
MSFRSTINLTSPGHFNYVSSESVPSHVINSFLEGTPWLLVSSQIFQDTSEISTLSQDRRDLFPRKEESLGQISPLIFDFKGPDFVLKDPADTRVNRERRYRYRYQRFPKLILQDSPKVSQRY